MLLHERRDIVEDVSFRITEDVIDDCLKESIEKVVPDKKEKSSK